MEEPRYYIKGQEEIGLVDSFTLRQHLLASTLHNNSQVRQEDTTHWLPISDLPLWEQTKHHLPVEPEADLLASPAIKIENKLELAINIFAYLAFTLALAALIYFLDHKQLWPAITSASRFTFGGLLLLATSRILRYLRTLTKQGNTQ